MRSRLRIRFRALRDKRELDREMDAELRFHIEMETARLAAQGMSDAAARRLALARFGPLQRAREEIRDARGVSRLEDFMQDLKYALRMLIKNPGFSAVSVLTLALGIGAITVIFSVVNAVLLEPLPFERPHELVFLWTENEASGQSRYFVSPMEFDDWRQQNSAFADVAAFWRTQVTVTETDGGPTRMQSALSSANLFGVLGARPVIGRVFSPEDGAPGAANVAVLSYGLWQRRFGGDPAIVGQTLTVDETPTAVVGVLGPDQSFPEDTEIWTNINFPLQIQSRHARWLNAVGRMLPAASVPTAQADMDTISARLQEEYPASNDGWTTSVASVHETLVGDVRPALLVLLASTGLILAIACANVANLLLSRSESRAREIAVRTAFGAGRGRLARQLLTESLVLAGVGALAGLGLTVFGLRLLQSLAPENLPRVDDVHINGVVLLVTLSATLLTGFFFGLAPVLRLLRADLHAHLKEGTKGSKGREGHRLQNGFVIAQLALALVLVVGSGLLVRSFANLRSTDPGFRTSGLVTFELDVPNQSYSADADVSLFYGQLIAALRELPGIEAATFGSSLPLRESRDYNQPFVIVDRPPAEDVEYRAYYRQVDPAYFEVMGIPMLNGRSFSDLDLVDSPGVVLINETMAATYWPDSDPIGEKLTQTAGRYGPLGAMLVNDVEIVGVVEDVKYSGLKLDSEASLYFSYRQAPFRRMTVALRTSLETGTVVNDVRAAVNRLDPGMPISNIATIESVVDLAMARDRFSTLLLTVFGGVALVLAAVGIYGVLSFAVEQRMREVGIRLALGARGGDVLRLILRDGVLLTLAGLGIGLVAAFGFTRLLSSQLYGVSATDVTVFAAVAVFLSLVAVSASYLPARRATRADPLLALRAE